jgi:LysM repeat protein
MSDKLIEAFLQLHNKNKLDEKVGVPLAARQRQQQDAANAKTTSNIMSREPTEAPSSIGTRVRQGVDAVGAGITGFKNQALLGKEVAAFGDYAVKNTVGRLLGGQGTTLEKEYKQEQEKEARTKLNNPTGYALGTAAGDVANIASLAGLAKTGAKFVAKKVIGSVADDATKVAKGIDGEITTAAPKPGYKDITPPSSTSVTRTATDVKPAAPSSGPSTSLSRPNSSSVGPAMRTVDDVPPRLSGPTSPRALPSPSQSSSALGGFSKVPNVGRLAAATAAGGAATVVGSNSAGDKAAAEPTAPAPEKYKIAQGDNLSTLAKKWNVSVADIAKANQGIKDVHKIQAGAELIKPAATGNKIYQGGIGTKSGPSQSQNLQKPKLKTESSEMTNKLIDAFLHLQSTNSSNMFAEAKKAKKLDPVGKEDEDIDNDGDKDKSDSYLHNRRKAIKAAMKEATDPNAEGIAKDKQKAPIMVPKPDYPTSKPGPTRELKGSLPKGVTVKGNTNEEVEIDESRSALMMQDHSDAKNMSPDEKKAKHKKYLDTAAHHEKRSKDKSLTQNQRMASSSVATAAKMAAAEWKNKYMKEEVEQIDEALSAEHKAAIKAHVKGMWGRGEVAFGSQGGKDFVSHSDGIQKHVHSIHYKKGVPHVTHFLSMDEEVGFSESELEHIAAILEANPVAPVPDDYSGAAGGVSKRDLSDETVAEEEVKRGRGRPKGSKSGSMHGSGTGEGGETKNLAAQIRFSRPSDGNFMLKHPKTGVTKAVPAKAATEFYSKYSGAEKPAEKEAHHDAFLTKHFGGEKPKVGITLPAMPKSKG